MSEKKITIGIDVKKDHPGHRASYAMKEFRNQIAKHFRTKNYAIDSDINSFFWKEGKKNWPTKVSIVSVEDNGRVYIFLEGSEGYKKFKNKGKEEPKEKKEAKKAEKPKAEKESKPKAEKKEEVKEAKEEKPKAKETDVKEKKTETKPKVQKEKTAKPESK